MGNRLSDDSKKVVDPDFFLLRTPLMPLEIAYDFLESIRNRKQPILEYLKEHATINIVLEALYIASPDLYDQFMRYIKGEPLKKRALVKLEDGLYKYFVRMCTRCTPFGLFAMCTHGEFSDRTALPSDVDALSRYCRLDMGVLFNVYAFLLTTDGIRENSCYYPNSSLYRIGKFFRYAESKLNDTGRRTYNIVKLPLTRELALLIKASEKGKAYPELIGLLTSLGHDISESTAYINELIDSQVLISELYPNITGASYFDRIIALLSLKPISQHGIIEDLKKIQLLLHKIDLEEDKIAIYKNIYTILDHYVPEIKEKNLLQIDTYRNFKEPPILHIGIKSEILEAIGVLNKLNPFDEQHLRINQFKKRFEERYEQRMIPLSEALDVELGLNYKNTFTETYPQPASPAYGHASHYKMNKFLRWVKNGTPFIIEDEELSKFNTPLNLPASFSSLISVNANEGNYEVFLKSISGPSGANLLGRFSYMNQELQENVRDICQLEEACDPNAVYAEITHLSQDRTGNILARPVLRDYEIPYLSFSTLPPGYQIPINDLYLFLRKGRFILYSKKLKKEIIPRLSTAHNFSIGLPIYNLLCDLQYQDSNATIFWNWETLSNQPHLPRVKYKNVILAAESWNLQKDDFLQLDETVGGPGAQGIMHSFASLNQEKYQLPQFVILLESDNELLLDLQNEVSVRYLIKHLKKHGNSKLKEFIWADARDKGKAAGIYCNEFSIPFINKNAAPGNKRTNDFAPPSISKKAQRTFLPGMQWLYFKIYTSPDTADHLLSTAIYPVIKYLLKENIIGQWFFIRYADPKPHLRIRLHLSKTEYCGQAIQCMTEKLAAHVNTGTISGLQIDSYIRELERYGEDTIACAEAFFSSCSSLCCEFMDIFKECKKEYTSLFGIYYLHKVIDGFMPSLADKIDFADKGGYNHREGSNRNGKSIQAFSDFYRHHSRDFEHISANDFTDLEKTGLDRKRMMKFRNACKEIAGKSNDLRRALEEKMTAEQIKRSEPGNLLFSYVHMSANRFFTHNQNQEELKAYHFLYKYYLSLEARRKNA